MKKKNGNMVKPIKAKKKKIVEEKLSDHIIFTYGGTKFDYLSENPDKFDVVSGAHALSLMPRFAGHTYKPYFIAKHLIIACELSPEETKLEALMHDFNEAWMCDIPSGLKTTESMVGYCDLEDLNEKLIIKKFKLKEIKPGEVGQIDSDLAYLEALYHLNFDKRSWREPDGLEKRIKEYKKRSPSFLHDIQYQWHSDFCENKFLQLFDKYKR